MKISILVLLLFLVYVTYATPVNSKKKDRCSTLSCVHASATIIQKMNNKVDPCGDFYEFACGTFLKEEHTPDEKSTVDTLAIMKDKLTEYLLTLLTKPAEDDDPKLHKLAKSLYNSCLNTDRITERGKSPILAVIKATADWPMLEGNKWDESKFKLRKAILNFHEYISNSSADIFKFGDYENKIDATLSFDADGTDLGKVETSLKSLINSIAVSLNAENSAELTQDIEDLIGFEKELDLNFRKFKRLRLQHKSFITNNTNGFKENPRVKKFHKYVTYMNLISPFALANTTDYIDDIDIAFHNEYLDFIKKIPSRTQANFVIWRILQLSLALSDKDWRSIELTFEKEAYEKEDTEQRWIFCTDVVTVFAPVAIGSLYVSQYFTATDKQSADLLVDYIRKEYIETIENSTWMDKGTKDKALERTKDMVQYIGYHKKLTEPESQMFYDQLPELDENNLLEMGMAFKVFTADREYKKLYFRGEMEEDDWTTYSKPATINAFYNSKDNTIQFPAGILQSPNFDRDRPYSLNFGAIGSVIGHEITHAFDFQASDVDSWPKQQFEEYQEKVGCIVDQYSSYHVEEVEELLWNTEGINKTFNLRGNMTKKEDIADNGGVKLSFNAYHKFVDEFPALNLIPIGLQNFTQNELFFISYAQTFCSVARPKRLKNQVETDVHSLDKFRIIGTLSNMKEFAEAWNCPEGSRMNPVKKCAVW